MPAVYVGCEADCRRDHYWRSQIVRLPSAFQPPHSHQCGQGTTRAYLLRGVLLLTLFSCLEVDPKIDGPAAERSLPQYESTEP